MQNLNSTKIQRYIICFIVLVLGYYAGDQELVQKALEKFNHSTSINQTNQSSESTNEKIYFIGKYKVDRVVDGDTFHAKNENGEEEIIRIMAVDTLEMKEVDTDKLCFAKKQTAFTKDYLVNKDVYLYADKTQGLLDKYQRILAYVATSTENFKNKDENYFYNDYLIETGNADIYRANPPAILFKRFEDKMNIAKEKKLGMWGKKCLN